MSVLNMMRKTENKHQMIKHKRDLSFTILKKTLN